MKNCLILAVPSSVLLGIMYGPGAPAMYAVGEGGVSLLVYFLAAALGWRLLFGVLSQLNAPPRAVTLAVLVAVGLTLGIATTPVGAFLFGTGGDVFAAIGMTPGLASLAFCALLFTGSVAYLRGSNNDNHSPTVAY